MERQALEAFGLGEPECPLGYPVTQLENTLGMQEMYALHWWMRGQTAAICEGRRYSHADKRYEPDACAGHPHGVVYYRWDVERWARMDPVID